jgi:hypothetical protein
MANSEAAPRPTGKVDRKAILDRIRHKGDARRGDDKQTPQEIGGADGP